MTGTCSGEGQMTDEMKEVREHGRHIVLSRNHQDVAAAVEQIEEELTEAGSRPADAALFAAAAEEVLVNVANHAWPPGELRAFGAWILIRAVGGTLQARLVVEDDGVPFDPTQQAAADIDADMDERSIGGLGIHMVRKLTDQQFYTRAPERNLMMIYKSISLGDDD